MPALPRHPRDVRRRLAIAALADDIEAAVLRYDGAAQVRLVGDGDSPPAAPTLIPVGDPVGDVTFAALTGAALQARMPTAITVSPEQVQDDLSPIAIRVDDHRHVVLSLAAGQHPGELR